MSVSILSYDSEKHFCLKTFFLVKWFRPYFYVITATPIPPKKNYPSPEKSHPPLKIEILSSPLFKNLVGGSTFSPPRADQ